MSIAKQKSVAICPDCDEAIDFGQTRPTMGLKIACPYCEAYLTVSNLDPLTLEWDENVYDDDDDDWASDDWDDDDQSWDDDDF